MITWYKIYIYINAVQSYKYNLVISPLSYIFPSFRCHVRNKHKIFRCAFILIRITWTKQDGCVVRSKDLFLKYFCPLSFLTLYFVIRQRCVACCGERVAVVLHTWRNTFLVSRSMIHHTCVCSLHTMEQYPCNLKKIGLRTNVYAVIWLRKYILIYEPLERFTYQILINWFFIWNFFYNIEKIFFNLLI